MSSEANSPDVTLAFNDIAKPFQPVCKHFQSGFCKFGDRCRKSHLNEICENPQCDQKTCILRHPKSCKYFSAFSTCKFGDNCAYKHVSSSQPEFVKINSEINNLKATLENVLKSLSMKENEIKTLQEKVKAIESGPETSEPKISCDMCGKTYKTTSSLNSHIAKYHKPEVLRKSESETDSAINLSTQTDMREDDVSSPNSIVKDSNMVHHSVNSFNHDDDVSTYFNCYYCNTSFVQHTSLEKHIIQHHRISENCSSCYGCGEIFSDLIKLGRFEVLWIGELKVPRVEAICLPCFNSPEVSEEEFDDWVK